jgi:SAM-dependent methyltransferase
VLEIHHVQGTRGLQHAYEGIYSGCPIRHTDSLYRWILDLLRPQRGRVLLDIACGQGRLPQLAAQRGLKAYGMDLSAQAVIAGHGRGAQLSVANGQQLPYQDASFDYVTSVGSLEHYVDPVEGIEEIARVLAPTGSACILVPNIYSLLGNVLHAWHTGRTADDGQPIQRFAARYEWQDLLEAHGLVVARTHKYECEPPTSLRDLISYLRRPKALVRLLVTPVLPLNLSNSFVYICSKGRDA